MSYSDQLNYNYLLYLIRRRRRRNCPESLLSILRKEGMEGKRRRSCPLSPSFLTFPYESSGKERRGQG
jgi:hypothetical protein